MKLDPNHVLSRGAVAAIRDLVPSDAVEIDDAALLQVALGVADATTRRACIEAVVASNAVRARLVAIRAQVRRDLGDGLESGDRADLDTLRIFAGPFAARDAAAVLPERFGDPSLLARLASRGWLVKAGDPEAGIYALAEGARAPALFSRETGADAESTQRFVSHYADRAAWIDRMASEGCWSAAGEVLWRDIPNLRAAWNRADALAAWSTVEAFTRALVVPLSEGGAWDDLADLIAAGHRAARALDSTRLRAWLLSLEGVAAARVGKRSRARNLWTRRLRLARRLGNHAVEADTLIDLANLAREDGDHESGDALLQEAAPAVAASGRADLAATLWTVHGKERLRVGDVEGAATYAERALRELTGVEGINVGLYVRVYAAATLRRCGRLRSASDAMLDVLSLSVEGGSGVNAAIVLTEIAEIVEGHGRIELADRCLELALEIHRGIGTRHVEAAGIRLDSFRECHRLGLRPESALRRKGSWEKEAEAIAAEVASFRDVLAER